MTRPGRREAEIDPDQGPLQRFAHEFRVLRRQTGSASFQDLARQTRQMGCPFSASTLRNAASGVMLPTGAVVTAFVRACMRHAGQNRGALADPAVLDWDTEELVSRWVERRDELARELTQPPAVSEIQPTVTEVVPAVIRAQQVVLEVQPVVPEPGTIPGLPKRRRSPRRAAVLGVLAAAVVAVVGVILWSTLPGPAKIDETGEESVSSAAPVPVDSLPPELASGQCRGAFETRFASINPCIKSTDAGLEIVVHVVARKVTPEIAIHLWLHDATDKKRLPETLHFCQAAFMEVGQTTSCGPVTIQPEPGHDYSAAASVEEGTSSWPSLWRDPKTTGLTSPALPWPAEA